MKTFVQCWVCVMLLSLLSQRVQAEAASDERARALYDRGTQLFTESKYDVAEQAFAEAYALSLRAGFLWNMAECARLSGSPERALTHYRAYLEKAPEGKQRPEAEEWIKRLAPSETTAVQSAALPAAVPVAVPNLTVSAAPPTKTALPALQTNRDDTVRPLRKKWWLWTGVAAVVVAGTVTTALLARPRDSNEGTPEGPYVVDWRSP